MSPAKKAAIQKKIKKLLQNPPQYKFSEAKKKELLERILRGRFSSKM